MYQVTRNGVELNLANFKIIRGDNKDKEYPAVPVSAENIGDVTKWLGTDTVISIVQTFIKRACQELWLDNIGEDGQPNIAKFLEEVKELTSASLKLSDLKEKYDELVAKQGMLVESLDLENPNIATLTSIKELKTAIQVVKAQMEAKSRKTKPEAVAEAAVAV